MSALIALHPDLHFIEDLRQIAPVCFLVAGSGLVCARTLMKKAFGLWTYYYKCRFRLLKNRAIYEKQLLKTSTHSPGKMDRASTVSHATIATRPRGRVETSRKSTIVDCSLSEIQAMRKLDQDGTLPDGGETEELGDEFWMSLRAVSSSGKTSVHLRLDSDVVEWFKSHDKGHLIRVNSVLREYIEEQQRYFHSPNR